MLQLESQLELQRCPFCNIDMPSLTRIWNIDTASHSNHNPRRWAVYRCSRCGGLVTAAATPHNNSVIEIYPSVKSISESIPSTAREYLAQAQNSLHSPAGAVMLAASAVDAMLKDKGYKKDNLYPRINKATEDHLITEGMAKWAHQVRLEANDQRHADEGKELPTEQEAKNSIDFAFALGEFLFVLPSRVTRGLEETSQ